MKVVRHERPFLLRKLFSSTKYFIYLTKFLLYFSSFYYYYLYLSWYCYGVCCVPYYVLISKKLKKKVLWRYGRFLSTIKIRLLVTSWKPFILWYVLKDQYCMVKCSGVSWKSLIYMNVGCVFVFELDMLNCQGKESSFFNLFGLWIDVFLLSVNNNRFSFTKLKNV